MAEDKGKTEHYQKASFWPRVCAYLSDLIILAVSSIILSELSKQLSFPDQPLSFLLPVIYSTLFIWKKGATPGKMLCKIRVVDVHYQPVTFGKALLRESVGKWISGLVLGIGYIWNLVDNHNQNWHDKMAKTYVVKTDTKGHLIPEEHAEKVTTKRTIAFVLLLVFNPFFLPMFFLIVYSFFFRPFQITGIAMNPNFTDREYVMTQMHPTMLNHGDVVILKAPFDPEREFIKRIIAVPGETVLIKEGKVYINDTLLDERSYLPTETLTFGGKFLPDGQTIVVAENTYFVLGDNRPNSSDSREWGLLPQKNITSKVQFCYWNCK